MSIFACCRGKPVEKEYPLEKEQSSKPQIQGFPLGMATTITPRRYGQKLEHQAEQEKAKKVFQDKITSSSGS